MSMNLYLYWEWFLALGLQHYVLFKNRGADSREIKHCWLENDPLLDCSNRNKLGCILGYSHRQNLEMKKGSRAAVSGKGWGPKPRQKISDITDFQKKEFWK